MKGLAKLKCRLVNIYALRSEYEELLKRLQQLSVIDIDTAALDEKTAALPDGYSPETAADCREEYARKAETAEKALKILNRLFPEKKGLAGLFNSKRELSEEEFYLSGSAAQKALDAAEEVIEADRRTAELKAEAARLDISCGQLSVWADLDLPLSFSGTRTTSAFIGTVNGVYTSEELYERLAFEAPGLSVYTEIINTVNEMTYIFACCKNEASEALETALRALGFAKPQQPVPELPRDRIAADRRREESCRKEIGLLTEKIKKSAEKRREIENFADFCRNGAERCRTAEETGGTGHTVLIRGYAAERDLPYLKKALERRFTVVIETEEADSELAPVILQNNAFARPAEGLVKMYSLPGPRDIDPTALTGFFYYLFFGMMFSDAGYGLIMVAATLFALKRLKLSRASAQNMRLFLYCGISTTLWGLVYGSFFGDSIAVISESFFGKRIALPALIDPMNGDAVALLVLSLALGFAEIIAGLCAKFVTCLKNGDRAGAFFDAGLWITCLSGAAAAAVGFTVLPSLKAAGTAIALVSVAGLILTQGRDKKNPVARLFSGIISLYDITGYVSDLLSFSRLMALGLTTSAMGAVFNMLASMAGRSVGGIIMLIIIFPAGHIINFGLNVLGAYVHTLRLQYVELFSKFYEGGGREFKAFSFKSRYTDLNADNLKEEN